MPKKKPQEQKLKVRLYVFAMTAETTKHSAARTGAKYEAKWKLVCPVRRYVVACVEAIIPYENQLDRVAVCGLDGYNWGKDVGAEQLKLKQANYEAEEVRSLLFAKSHADIPYDGMRIPVHETYLRLLRMTVRNSLLESVYI